MASCCYLHPALRQLTFFQLAQGINICYDTVLRIYHYHHPVSAFEHTHATRLTTIYFDGGVLALQVGHCLMGAAGSETPSQDRIIRYALAVTPSRWRSLVAIRKLSFACFSS